MATPSKQISAAASPASASFSSPISFRSRPRRDSLASASTTSQALALTDKERLAQALDKIHTSASQSDSLTTFNDFANPPGAAPATESRNAGELVQQGLSGLYTRLREAVGGAVGVSKAPHDELEQDVLAIPTKRSSIPPSGHSASKSSVSSIPRVDTAAILKSSTAATSDGYPASTSSANNLSVGPDAQQYSQQTSHQTSSSSSKAAATAAAAAAAASLASGSKTPTSGRQSLPASVKSVSTAPLEAEASRGSSRMSVWTDDTPQSRISTRKLANKADTHPLASPSDTSSVFEYKENPQTRTNDGMVSTDGSTDTATVTDTATATATASPAKAPKLPLLQTSGFGKGMTASSSALSLTNLRKPAGNGRGIRSPAHSASQSSSLDVATGQPILSGQHAGAVRVPFNPSAVEPVTVKLARMKRQVLSKEFWMKDETCKECFLCATSFTAFRRKHHCRTCGCIFDSKCTSIISGQEFGVNGSIRVCKTCLDIINRRSGFDASGSDDSGDETYLPAIFRPGHTRNAARGASPSRAESSETSFPDYADVKGTRTVTTPMMAIPATRRIGESSNRNSAVLEIDAPHLSRPSSSRSLKSLAARPQSSGHKRHHSKHNILGRFRPVAAPNNRAAAPFRKGLDNEISQQKQKLSAFHDDNIIDPELAAYMSDESSGDEQMSIFATMNTNDLHAGALDSDRGGVSTTYPASGKKHRHRQGDKSISGLSFANRPFDDASPMVGMASHQRPARRRNLSNVSGSVHHLRSPRPKSGVLNATTTTTTPATTTITTLNNLSSSSNANNNGNKLPSASNETLSAIDKEVILSAFETPTVTRSGSMCKSAHKPVYDLNPASMHHAKRLLRQLLQDAQIPNGLAWEKALMPVLLRSTEDVDPDIKGAGDFMDIRKYVKIKKIPGARPGDTSYVSGVIFTKKLALKSMPRKIKHPRIVIITFPIEYQRHQQHFMSLQPVIEQEKEYLRLVVNRIIKLNPQVVLTEKGVSGVALQYLAEANISVAYNVNPRVLDAVARCTTAQLLSSVDMLSLELAPGGCESFEVRTFVNNDFPGRKKSYVYLSGCQKSLGCTIALRGASTDVLARVKVVTEFMVYVVYNMKLESCLMRDSNVCLPPDVDGFSSTPGTSQIRTDDSVRSVSAAGSYATTTTTTAAAAAAAASNTNANANSNANANANVNANVNVNANSNANINTNGKGGPTVVVETATDSEPPSQASVLTVSTDATAASTDDSTRSEPADCQSQQQQPRPQLFSAHQSHRSQGSHDSQVPEDVPMPTYYSDMIAKYETKILSASPFVKFTQPYLLMKAREQERRLVYLKRLRDQDMVEQEDKGRSQRFQLIDPAMIHAIGQKAPAQIMEVLHAVHDAEYDKALHNYQIQTKQWESYIQGNLDLFDPYSHQNVVVLHSMTCTDTKIPCVEPHLIALAFYEESAGEEGMDTDITIGQFIEGQCLDKDAICDMSGCEKKMSEHHRTYVHDQARVTIFVEHIPMPDPLPPGRTFEDIMMWSYCKLCEKDSPQAVMAAGTWKYSFGKYLESLFWSKSLRMNPEVECPHEHSRDHIRYFTYRNGRVRLHYDPIDLLEIVVPRTRITWKVENDLKLKNHLFTSIQDRWCRFIGSVQSRLMSITIDNVLPEKAAACKAELERLAKKTQDDQVALVRKLQEVYVNSKYYEVTPFNVVVRDMMLKSAEWDSTFAKFEADFLGDKDLKQLTIIQLRKIFSDGDEKSTQELPEMDEKMAVQQADVVETTEVGGDYQAKTDSQGSVDGEAKEDEKAEEKGDEKGDEKVTVSASGVLEAVEPLDLATSELTPEQARTNCSQPIVARRRGIEASEGIGEVLVEDLGSTRDSAILTSSHPEPKTAPLPVVLQVGDPELSLEIPSQVPHPSEAMVDNKSTAAVSPTTKLPNNPDGLEKTEVLLRRNMATRTESTAGSEQSSRVSGLPQRTIPIPERGSSSRRTGTNPSPPLNRTQSQPERPTLARVHTGNGRISGPGPGPGPGSGSGPGSGPGPRDNKISQIDAGGSEPDLAVKMDKKLTDRLAEALKTHRKSGQSSIPRLVHKRRESKVSTLAKHFEQLSREFERERIKDRKKRGGPLAQRRAALPRTSTKAIVEVYDDVNEAVQEPGPSDLESVVDRDTTGKSSGPPTVVTDASTETSAAAAEVPGGSGEAASSSSAAAPSLAPSLAPSEEPQPAEGDESGTVNNSIGGSDDDGGASDGDRSILEDLLPDVNEIADSLQPNTEIPLELPKHQKISLMKMLTNFWTERSASSWPQLEYPLSSSEHLFMDSDIIVREDEPSSLIAFALSSEDYREKLATIRRNCQEAMQGGQMATEADAGEVEVGGDMMGNTTTTTAASTMAATTGSQMGALAAAEASIDMVMLADEPGPGTAAAAAAPHASIGGTATTRSGSGDGDGGDGDGGDGGGGSSSGGEAGPAEVGLETSLLRSTGTHLKYQFREGSATMLCKIFYAEQFDALRNKCGVADRFIESLSRCIKWDSKGGKTKSTFLKTLDDRWVCKSLSPIETSAFLRFAPSYFGIMAEVLFHDLPSVIAKMLGFFQIIIKNPTANTEIKLDLLVMENLFYDRTPSRIFDLKGSMRNRKIQSTGEQNEVLLDENMVEYIYESPLFAREHSKKLLRASVWNDTLFLARQNVMDYSLMVAVDAARKELVVGIIDCIRTYTWDKKLESWIKDRGFAGGGRNRPTVTSPKDYKSRFREAMARYILQAPNCWHQFGGTRMQAIAKLPFEDNESNNSNDSNNSNNKGGNGDNAVTTMEDE